MHMVPGVVGGSRFLCKGHFFGRMFFSSPALLIRREVTLLTETFLSLSLCSVSTVKQAGEIRLRFSLCGELDTLGIMLETTESALTRSSQPHGMN